MSVLPDFTLPEVTKEGSLSGVGVGNPVAVPGSVFESALAVSRVATDSMGNWMGRGDRLLSRS